VARDLAAGQPGSELRQFCPPQHLLPHPDHRTDRKEHEESQRATNSANHLCKQCRQALQATGSQVLLWELLACI